jgi:hypothetical protein
MPPCTVLQLELEDVVYEVIKNFRWWEGVGRECTPESFRRMDEDLSSVTSYTDSRSAVMPLPILANRLGTLRRRLVSASILRL